MTRELRGAAWMGLVLLALSGCSYPISRELRREAKGGPTFQMVLANPDAYKGRVVIWGGRVIETTNLPAGSELLVLETPLDSGLEPLASRYSQGRFIAKANCFLDPAIYRKGREVTVAGEVVGKESRPLGKTTYPYPAIAVKQIYLWPKARPYYYYYPDYDWYWYGGPYWGPGPWWGPGPYWGYGPPIVVPGRHRRHDEH